jgi:hypothetical protein
MLCARDLGKSLEYDLALNLAIRRLPDFRDVFLIHVKLLPHARTTVGRMVQFARVRFSPPYGFASAAEKGDAL